MANPIHQTTTGGRCWACYLDQRQHAPECGIHQRADRGCCDCYVAALYVTHLLQSGGYQRHHKDVECTWCHSETAPIQMMRIEKTEVQAATEDLRKRIADLEGVFGVILVAVAHYGDDLDWRWLQARINHIVPYIPNRDAIPVDHEARRKDRPQAGKLEEAVATIAQVCVDTANEPFAEWVFKQIALVYPPAVTMLEVAVAREKALVPIEQWGTGATTATAPGSLDTPSVAENGNGTTVTVGTDRADGEAVVAKTTLESKDGRVRVYDKAKRQIRWVSKEEAAAVGR